VTSQSAATLRSRYVAQAASDLEENRRRQQELADRISVLKQEEALLSDILNLAERYEGFADASRLPEQSQDEPVVAKAKKASTGAAARRSTSAKSAPTGRTAKADAKGKSRQPLLGELLASLTCRVGFLRCEFGVVNEQTVAELEVLLGGRGLILDLPAAGHHPMLDQPLALVTALRAVLGHWVLPRC